MTAQAVAVHDAASSAADPLAAALAAFLLPRLPAGPRLAVGLSGGRDSVVLLHLLKDFQLHVQGGLQIIACHVHHGLSPHADAWADFCTDYCKDLAIPCRIVRVQVDRQQGIGLEAAARAARYEAFAQLEVDALLLAHHQNDQAETLLLNLLRGSGVSGLAAMQVERPLAPGSSLRLWRPLLNQPGELLARYALAHGLRWVEDQSNADTGLRRNFLRHEVMPRLRAGFPEPAQQLARAADLAAEASRLLDDLATIDRADVLGQPPAAGLLVSRLVRLSPERQRNLLRYEMARAGWRAPSQRWLQEAMAQLQSASSDARIWLVHADGVLTSVAHVHPPTLETAGHACSTLPRQDGLLCLLPRQRSAPPSPLSAPLTPVRWRGETRLPWGSGWVSFTPVVGAGLSSRWLGEKTAFEAQIPTEVGVWLKPRTGGERFCPDPKRPRRALKKILNEAAVPTAQRQHVPLLWHGAHLLWVGGFAVDVTAACAPGEPGWQLEWLPGAE